MSSLCRCYTGLAQGQQWMQRYQGQKPLFACVLGFTETGLIPGISAAGATPADRQFTAIADAEYLVKGPHPEPSFPLPPLQAGASPVLITRAVVEALNIPIWVFNAGLPHPPSISAIDLGGMPARCLSSGQALSHSVVQQLLEQGLIWGQKLAEQANSGYVILGECVVGGTTTALALLTGLGIAAAGKVNSSHPTCNHQQKWKLVQTGLRQAQLLPQMRQVEQSYTPLQLVAAIGDPMQIAVAGMAIAASRQTGVLLAGGTQMLTVYALARAISRYYQLSWQPDEIVVGTTRWVAEDPTADTVGLAHQVGEIPLLATQLCLSNSRWPSLRLYERGFVKEGVGAGGCAIAATLSYGWQQADLLKVIDQLADRHWAVVPQAESVSAWGVRLN